jgi:4-azaleucine resistance transporter AzlC
VLGYLPAAAAFGLVARGAGLGVSEAVLASVAIFAGASQFALVGLAVAGSPVPVAAATLLFLNLRHALYGASLAPYLRRLGPKRTALAAFGLTDEVFAVSSARAGRQPIGFGWLLGLEAGAYASWVFGTWAGAAGGAAFKEALPAVQPALSFALPVLFAALLISLLTGTGGPARSQTVVAVAVAAATAAALRLAGADGWSVLVAGVVGPAAAIAVAKLRRGGGGQGA